MRLTFVFASLGLAIRYVDAQEQWRDFGAMPDILRKPFYDAVPRSPSFAKRDGTCGEMEHPCSDVNSTLCCDNTEYCIINETSLAVQCCQLGSTCGMKCNEDQVYSLVTTTQTPTTSGPASVVTAAACVNRPCESTHYLCPQSMGGMCCAYGQDCASSGHCLDYGRTSTSVAAGPTVATMIPSGCSRQGDSICSVGGPGIATTTGCCGAGYACAVSDSRAICTLAPSSTSAGPTPTGSGVSIVGQSSRGLSDGAKAGIAVGVVVAAALVIGAATWFCIRRRRSGRSTTTGNEMASRINGSAGGHPRNQLAAAGRFESDDGGLRSCGPSSGPHMSEADGYAASSSGPGGGGGPLQGVAQDYFGPVAASGPYTTPPEQPGSTPDYLARPVWGDGGTPHGPDDIAAPVEIGSGSEASLQPKGKDVGGGGGLDGSNSSILARRQQQRQGPGSPNFRDSIAGRVQSYELYGSEVPAEMNTRAPRPLGTPGSELSASELGTPSPMSHEEQQQQQQQQESARRADG